MAEIRGIDMVLQVQSPSSPSQYLEVDAVSELGMQVSNSSEDKTTKASDQKRTLSTATAMKSYSCDVSFVADSSSLDVLEDAAFGMDPGINAKVIVGSAKNFTGRWLISNFSYKSQASGVVTGTMTLESAGAIAVA